MNLSKNVESIAITIGPLPADVKRAIEFINTNLTTRIKVADIVSSSGASERTLYLHFQAFLGISPKNYLNALRLEKTRQALTDPEQFDTVKAIARRYGFTQAGRFAGTYKQCFGESPNETLKRTRLENNNSSAGLKP